MTVSWLQYTSPKYQVHVLPASSLRPRYHVRKAKADPSKGSKQFEGISTPARKQITGILVILDQLFRPGSESEMCYKAGRALPRVHHF